MVEAKHHPLEDAANIKWFNQMMDEQHARYLHHSLRSLQETEDGHLIWNYNDPD